MLIRAILAILFLAGAYPLLRAWKASRHSSLIQAVHWAITAWLGWLATLLLADEAAGQVVLDPARYLALCLTGCSGVAVLGARRPHVGAWNFVILGLLAVMVLPLAEGLLALADPLGPVRTVFLGATLAVGILNYLPTCMAAAVFLLALGCGGEMIVLYLPDLDSGGRNGVNVLALVCLGLVPWTAQWSWRRSSPPRSEFDRLWLDFRNRFGLVWAQRTREQFNRAVDHASWPVHLYWQGLRLLTTEPPLDPAVQAELIEMLKRLLKRFGPETEE
jgi:hypothetical protein